MSFANCLRRRQIYSNLTGNGPVTAAIVRIGLTHRISSVHRAEPTRSALAVSAQ